MTKTQIFALFFTVLLNSCIFAKDNIDYCVKWNIDKTKCLKCQDGTFLSPDDQKVCLVCDFECHRCADIKGCTECSKGFWLKQFNECVNCPESCSLCETREKCTKCRNEFDVLIDGKCIFCPKDQYYDIDLKKCSSCMKNCIRCKQDVKEELEQAEFYKTVNLMQLKRENGSNSRRAEGELICLTCVEGYHVNLQNNCSPCGDNCRRCNSKECFSCKIGFFSGSSGKCRPCPHLCAKCASSVVCDKCNEGMTKQPRTGFCYSENPIVTYFLYLGVFSVAIFLVFCVGFTSIIIQKYQERKKSYLNKYLDLPVSLIPSETQSEQPLPKEHQERQGLLPQEIIEENEEEKNEGP